MRLVVELSEAKESLHRLITVQDYQTIDTVALVDVVIDCYRTGYCNKELVLDVCLDSIPIINTCDICPDSHVKMVQDIANLIHCVLSTFEDYKIDQILNKGFTTITIVKQWRNNYVFEFT